MEPAMGAAPSAPQTAGLAGAVHSIESMGLVDGPGIRSVVFLQGCRLRCQFCHNPDTWAAAGGEMLTPAALVARLARFRPYFDRSGGGVTFSGGEPLGQPAFLAECLRLCRQSGIRTCLDTAGVGPPALDYDPLLELCDLVLFDIKHWEPAAYRALTGQAIAETERFCAALRRVRPALWVRHVVVPGRTDNEQALGALRQYLTKVLPPVQRVELLPYHRLGEHKYAALGLPYPLAGVPAMDRAACAELARRVFGTEAE